MDDVGKINYYNLFDFIYKGKTVLVTGHTGFKGSWLSLILSNLGAKVVGYSLPPETKPNHYEIMSNKLDIISIFGDIRDKKNMLEIFKIYRPEVVFHLAAQPYVRRSYINPIETYETNVIGTLNLLECIKEVKTVKAAVIITSDKCYENKEWFWSYREIDSLGGKDPYSSSKACVEILVKSYKESFFSVKNYKRTHETLISTCRAGNVIGGGDWGEDRLIPDIVRSIQSESKCLILRNPDAIRPWQHVIEVSSGYLLVGMNLLKERVEFADAWNFSIGGPDITVVQIVEMFRKHWFEFDYKIIYDDKFPEHKILKLDSSKARTLLGWRPVWDVYEAIGRTIKWYRDFYEKGSVLTEKDIEDYFSCLINQCGGKYEKG